MADDLGQRLDDSVSTALGDMLVTKWVALVETIEDDGTRALWISASEGLCAWDTIGILDYAATRERANVAEQLRDERDD